MKVLIVDDSRSMRLIVARGLREIGVPGHPYLEAPDGKAALATILEHRPELVISDFNMPEMNGMQLLESLKEKGITTCFGFVTSEASDQLHEEATIAGARFVITKPFTAENLGRTLAPCLPEIDCNSVPDDRAVKTVAGINKNSLIVTQVITLLKELLRRCVTLTPPVKGPPSKSGQLVAEYLHSADGSLVAWIQTDVPFAARSGAALSLIPAAVANEAIAAGELTDTIGENYREVLNVLGRLFDEGGHSRVRLARIHLPGAPLPPELASRIKSTASSTELYVDIAGYGVGRLALLAHHVRH